jgi:hypothetical protein
MTLLEFLDKNITFLGSIAFGFVVMWVLSRK